MGSSIQCQKKKTTLSVNPCTECSTWIVVRLWPFQLLGASWLALIFVRRIVTGGWTLATLCRNSTARSPHKFTNTGPVKAHKATSSAQFSGCPTLLLGDPNRFGIVRGSLAHSVAKPSKMYRVLGRPSARMSLALTKNAHRLVPNTLNRKLPRPRL